MPDKQSSVNTGDVYSINQIQNIVAPIAKRYNVNSVYLFGSYARGEQTSESDIDIMIMVDMDRTQAAIKVLKMSK